MIRRLLKRWEIVIFIVIVTRICLIIFSNLVASSSWNEFYRVWVRWDGPHYIDIARNGYQSFGEQSLFIVFYPLYPILIKLFSFLAQNFEFAAIIVSLTFSLFASIALYELAGLDFGKRVGLGAVWFLNIYPTAYFLQSSHTESLYLTLSILTIYLYRTNMFVASGLLGLLSTMTRVNGLLLPIVLLFELKKFSRSLISVILIPLGFLFYLCLNFITFGDFFYFLKPLGNHWHKSLEWPWVGISNLIRLMPSYTDGSFYEFFSEVSFILFITIISLLVFLKTRFSYFIYTILNLLLFISTDFILSTPRYSLILFPIFIALGTIKNKAVIVIISSVFIMLLFYYTSFYVKGKWAF